VTDERETTKKTKIFLEKLSSVADVLRKARKRLKVCLRVSKPLCYSITYIINYIMQLTILCFFVIFTSHIIQISPLRSFILVVRKFHKTNINFPLRKRFLIQRLINFFCTYNTSKDMKLCDTQIIRISKRYLKDVFF